MPGKHLEYSRTWKLFHYNCACNEENCTEWVKLASFQWNKSCVQWKYRNTQWKWGKQWCGTCLRAKQMQNGAREKYWNMENEKSLWCNRRAEQWSNWWRIVWRRLRQKLWTKIFFAAIFWKSMDHRFQFCAHLVSSNGYFFQDCPLNLKSHFWRGSFSRLTFKWGGEPV